MNNNLQQLAFDFGALNAVCDVKDANSRNQMKIESSKIVRVDFQASRMKRAEIAKQALYKGILDSIRHIG